MPTNFYQRSAMAAAIAACFPGAAPAANVARVDFAVGQVAAVSPDGRSRPLRKGSQIEVGETVATNQGRAQLRFADGALMSLQPQTEFKVEEFRFSGKKEGDEDDNIVMNLLKGGMRTITGLIGRVNKSNYKLRTEVATIGIRGTEYTVRYTNSIEVFCVNGQIFVLNDGGQLVLAGGQGAQVSDFQTPPQRRDEPPVLPPSNGGGENTTEKPDDPNNPTQESDPVVTEEEAEKQLAEQQPPPPPPPPPLLTGTLSGNGAISVHSDDPPRNLTVSQLGGQGVFDANGVLTSFTHPAIVEGPAAGTVTPGTSSIVQSQGNDGHIAWGRWIDGVLGGTGGLNGLDTTNEGALHYVVGLPVTNMPTSGTATYAMIGATTPTFSIYSGIEGATVNSSSIIVDFGSSMAALNLSMGVTTFSGPVALSTPQGGIPISRIGAILGGSGTMDVSGAGLPFCAPYLTVSGFLAGEAASRAGLAYKVQDQTCISCSHTINGAIAYKKQ